MTQRETGNKGKDADAKRDVPPKTSGTPGAFGEEGTKPKGQSGVTHTRTDYEDMHPSAEAEEDDDSKD